jgi:uncharacterized protein
MDCSYCYQHINGYSINNTVKKGILKFVNEQINLKKICSLNVTWFGGEPLLQKDFICNISEPLINICSKNNIEYNANIITNGILLNKDVALELKEKCKISTAQVTIDGIKEIHNSRRRYYGGDGFSIILKNICECKKILKIRLRINVDD